MSPAAAVQEQLLVAPRVTGQTGEDSPPVIARRYRVDSLIGEGGMARVYRGWHLPFDQPIAIKILKEEYSSDKEAVTRFLQEARAGALLRGKHVAQVFDIGRMEGGPPFMVTELLSGRDLQEMLIEQGPFPIAEAVQLLVRICTALTEVHTSGIVHRDLKPANIFLTEDKQHRPLVKLLDFGIAKRLDGQTLNDTKAGLGSPHYMAPEQIVTPEAVDQRADIWSLGIVLFELLTGRLPFDADTVPAVCGQVLKSEPTAPSSLREEIPAALDTIILTCLAKNPSERFQETLELRRALGSVLHGSASAPDGRGTNATELDIPVVVSITPPEPTATKSHSTRIHEQPRVTWRRRTSRVFAGLAVASACTLLVQGWPPARALVERASDSVAEQAHQGYARASKTLPDTLRLWRDGTSPAAEHPARERPPPAAVTADAQPPIPVTPLNGESGPDTLADPSLAKPQPVPVPRAVHNQSRGLPRARVSRARVDPIEGRYALTPVSASPKPPRDELLDPYPDLD